MKTLIGFAVACGLLCSGSALAQSQAAPAANPNAPQNSALKAPHDMKPGAPAAGHNSFTMGQAKDRIEKAGYSRVTMLAKDKDGLWVARAMKGGKRVHVAMDFQGNVSSK